MSTEAEKSYVYLVPEQGPGGTSNVPQPTALTEGDNIYKIRDLLFGSYIREYERRFVRLDERMLKEATELRDELRRRYDALEMYIKKEIDALREHVKEEQQTRLTAARRGAQELQELNAALERETGQLAERLSMGQRELRQLMLEQSKTLSEDIHQRYAALADTLARHIQEIQIDKADRATLADLFREVAMRLTNEWQLPSLETGRGT
jgi:DNA repair exonuclease SbcCD ATPase subunit